MNSLLFSYIQYSISCLFDGLVSTKDSIQLKNIGTN